MNLTNQKYDQPSEQLQSDCSSSTWKYLKMNQTQGDFRATSERFQSAIFGNQNQSVENFPPKNVVKIPEKNLSNLKDLQFSEQVSDQLQSSFRAISEQFQSNFRATLNPVLERKQSQVH